MDEYDSPEGYATHCPIEACGTHPVITDADRGEVFCGGCGLVLLQRMEEAHHEGRPAGAGAGPRAGGGGGAGSGPAGTLAMHDRGLSTVIGKNVDSGGRSIPADSRQAFERMRVWDKRSRPKKIASFSKALTQLNAMKTKLAVPKPVAENAAYIYRKAVAAGLTRGRTMSSMVAASLYAACRESNTPRTLDDVAGVGNVERRILSRDLRTLVGRLGLRLGQYDTGSFVAKIGNNLGVKEKTKRDAVAILQKAEAARITAGKNPVAQAAASLYVACLLNGEEISQRRISSEAGISSVTIRNRAVLIRKTVALPPGKPY